MSTMIRTSVFVLAVCQCLSSSVGFCVLLSAVIACTHLMKMKLYWVVSARSPIADLCTRALNGTIITGRNKRNGIGQFPVLSDQITY